MLIRIVRALPAPVMDGFDVREFQASRLYEVDNRTGNYLIIAGYAERVEDTVAERNGKGRQK